MAESVAQAKIRLKKQTSNLAKLRKQQLMLTVLIWISFLATVASWAIKVQKVVNLSPTVYIDFNAGGFALFLLIFIGGLAWRQALRDLMYKEAVEMQKLTRQIEASPKPPA